MNQKQLLQVIQKAAKEGATELNLSYNQLSQLPPQIAQLSQLNKLHLSLNQLSQLPAEFAQLSQLTCLYLSNNQLSQILPEIAQLSQLTVLDLSNNQLSQILPEIAQLSQLTVLDLSNNQLSQLPPEIAQLSQLTVLLLRNNKLNQLPLEIARLSQLTYLDLSNNKLSQLPPEFAQLSQLTGLSLSNNQISQLPPEIAQLSQLTGLVLSNNQISQLLPEIAQLSQLTGLLLSNNQISQLPSEIAQLSQLTRLSLNNNQISQLSPEIAQLSQLRELDLSNNQLSQLPPEFAQLSQLRELDLSNNQLSQLPPEFAQLSQLTVLDLRGNPLPIPPEILDKTKEPQTIINYYRQEHKRPLNEIKMLLVGQGSIGKTSLVKRLIDNTYNPKENKTDGINIRQWYITVDNQNIRVNTWDFGGQEIMHATHQFFLTKRSLYLLVLDCRLSEEENRLEYWLKIIESFSDNSPIIIVGNKKDQHPLDIDKRGLQNKYPMLKGFIETSCATGEGIEELKQAIAAQIDHLDHVKDPFPVPWFNIKEQLEQNDQDYISYNEYQEICKQGNVTDDLSQKTLIGFLHDLGIILNFKDDPRLADNNVLNPEWVTNGVYKIINDRQLIIDDKGVLNCQELSRILAENKYPINKHLFIIDMMKKFELCFSMEEDKTYLIPEILPKEEPDTGDWTNSLAFQYHYNVLPNSIISRFTVRMNHLISKKTYWRRGVVLVSEQGNRALVKADLEDRKIFIFVSGNEANRRNFLNLIRDDFKAIHKTIPALQAIEKVPIPENPKIVVDYKALLISEQHNIAEIVPDGFDKPVNVKDLLNGIESEAKRLQKQPEREPKPPISNVINTQNVTISNSNVVTAENATNNDNKKGINWVLIWTIIIGFLTVIATLVANDNIRNDVVKIFQRNTTPSPTITPSKKP